MDVDGAGADRRPLGLPLRAAGVDVGVGLVEERHVVVVGGHGLAGGEGSGVLMG